MTTAAATTEVPANVLEYLQKHQTLTLATASTTGLPHAATEVYANDGLVLYFCSAPDTTTARHIEQNRAVSFTIDEYNPDWSKTKGIQGSGEAQVVLSPSEITRVVTLFKHKYPSLSDAQTSNLSVFRVTPTAVQFIDNEQAGQAAGQSLGTNYKRSMVYNIFRELPRQQVETVEAKMGTMQVPAGQIVVRQGAPADKFFMIAEGEVEVVREDDGQEHVVARLGQGQYFGEMAILRDMPRTASVRTLAPTTLFTMDRDVFRSLVAQSLGTTQDFDQIIQRRFDELAQINPGR